MPSSCGEIEPECQSINPMWMACGTILDSLKNQQCLDVVFFDLTIVGDRRGGVGPPTPPGSIKGTGAIYVLGIEVRHPQRGENVYTAAPSVQTRSEPAEGGVGC